MIYRGWKRSFVFGCVVSSCFWILLIRNVYICSSLKKTVGRLSPATSTNDATWKTNFDYVGLIQNENDILKRAAGYKRYSFNDLISERIGFHRIIPYTANEKCLKNVHGHSFTKKVSDLICFYNEAWSTLLRTIYSVINRTPAKLLQEIILFDDFSNYAHLVTDLPNYLKSNLPIVKYHKADTRHGLIRGRVKAAKLAIGDVLVFLDSHCEVNKYWLEPLLSRIEKDSRNVVCPVIDMISSGTFLYQASPLVRGGFNWGMHFTWEQLPDNVSLDPSEPYRYTPKVVKAPIDKTLKAFCINRLFADLYDIPPNEFGSPTMAGGLFAIDRKYFFELGEYDEGMEIWGGENLELSFRIWMCGGRLEIVPCSRVGHVFRSRRPYNDKADSSSVNAVRVANVWLDEYKLYFYKLRPDLMAIKTDVSSRIDLRNRLKCRTFNWYLDEIYPEMEIPNKRRGLSFTKPLSVESRVLMKGKLVNMKDKVCLDTDGEPIQKRLSIVARNCHQTFVRYWTLNDHRELQVNGKLCLEASLFQTSSEKTLRSMKCHGDKEGQEWRFNDNTQQLYNPANGMCLGYTNRIVNLEICNNKSMGQKWRLQ